MHSLLTFFLAVVTSAQDGILMPVQHVGAGTDGRTIQRSVQDPKLAYALPNPELEYDLPEIVYRKDPVLPEGVPERYRRSCYVHPLPDPYGTNVLDDFPADHLHHRGLSWMWPNVFVGEQRYDLWELKGIEQRFEETLNWSAGPCFTELGVRNGWYVGERRVVEERLWMRSFPVWSSEKEVLGYVLDLDLKWKALDEAVRLQGQQADKKGYGGVGIRLAPKRDHVIVTSKGPAPKDTLHVRYDWVDFSARFRDGKMVSGITLMSHPENPGHPNEWIIRHYGYVGCSWPGLEPVTIEAGESVRHRYRAYVHRGDATEAKVAEVYAAYVDPPKRGRTKD